ncbi:MAG TPA: AMP-dependent synthetase/ligase [Solirubrobacteraceae bacterium]|nr:AMP-dependent synthetase/ligase [Solirubrobacteraceae bacterium]
MRRTSTQPRDILAERSALEAAIHGRTLCSELARTAARHPDLDAIRWTTGDAWQSLSYRAYREQLCDAALGLRALGLERGGFALILTGNRPEHVVASQAVVHAQGTPVSVYEAIAPSQLAYIANHCEATVAIVDAERLDMVLDLRPHLPQIRQVVVCGSAATPDADGWLVGWEELLSLGRAHHRRDPLAFETSALGVEPDDVATVIYTSGTTGPPKGVVLTHRFALCWVQAMNMREQVVAGDRIVSYLPLAHCTSQWLTQWMPSVCATTTHFCADPTLLVATLRDVRPTVLLGVPRVWEKLRTALPPGAGLDAIGLDRCRVPIICAAPCRPELIQFFHALGLPLSDGWGMTELGFGTWNGLDQIRPGTIGYPMPGVEVRLGEDSELLVRGHCMMSGYSKDLARTADAIDDDGWLHTGDVAEVDADGYFRIVGRKKELIITTSGKNISPLNIEAMLQEQPLIANCCVIGDGRDHLTALIALEPTLAERADADTEVACHVAAVNERLSAAEQVVAFRIVPGEWTVAGEELTPTLKMRRCAIEQKYAETIRTMYA